MPLVLESIEGTKGIRMLITDWMSKNLITVDVHDSMHDVMALFKQHNIRRVPVMKKGKLIGIITDRDLRRVTSSQTTLLGVHELIDVVKKISIAENMTKDPITVPADYTIEEAAIALLENKISGVPVVDHNGEMVGIITQVDIFRALASLTGVEKKGVQFALELPDTPGSVKDVTDVIRRMGGHLVSILTAYDHAPSGYRRVYIRAHGIDNEKIPDLEKRLRESARILYIIDHGQNRRRIY